MRPPPVDVQVVSRQQRADGQQRYPQGQVEPAAGLVKSDLYERDIGRRLSPR
jgi:hypothetical protein